MTILAARGLSVNFQGVRALAGVDVSVAEGSIHALVGPNGAGKSTCFNVISGLYRPDQGTVLFDGAEITDWPPHRRARAGIGRTFQNLALVDDLSVADNIAVARPRDDKRRPGWVREAVGTAGARRTLRRDRDRVEELADIVGVSAQLDACPPHVSYGLRKRVELARALFGRPRLLLLDEPAAGLNDAETGALAEVIERIRLEMGSTILLVEHHMGLVMTVADEVTVLVSGELLCTGDPEAVQADERVREAYLGGSVA